MCRFDFLEGTRLFIICYYMKSILAFLKDLEKNNNRDWFNANKAQYLEAKSGFDIFIDSLIVELQLMDPRVAGATAKNSVFRIYKDIRFSKDKTPYKTHFGAYMISGGRKSQLPGYYIHIKNGESFIAGGMYKPGPDQLKAIRREILNFPEDIVEIVESKEFKENYSFHENDKLKRPPQGYSADAEQIELIKNKHFIASKSIPDEWITQSDFSRKLIDTCQGLLPLNNFIHRALTEQ